MPRRIRPAATPDRLPQVFFAGVLMPLLIVGAVITVYANSFSGVLLFDDNHSIVNNQRIRQLWPLFEVLSHRRPVVDLTLAINYALGELDVWGYHAVNVAVHAVAALALFGIVRRTLSSERFRDTFRRSSTYLALAVALIWAVHPLNTQSVTYVIQRCESMMGMFYLLTLYCFIRGVQFPRRVWWYVGAVTCSTLGMGSKAVMISAPVVVLLYDRTFISHSFSAALRRRWGLYVGLVATWGVLWMCGDAPAVLSASRKTATMGFSFKGIAPFDYAFTQPEVILYYLRLSLRPYPLCLDYGWPVARTFLEIVPPAVVIFTALAGTFWALVRKHWVGFLGAWFFLILAPTSSFIPIKDTLFEHRTYLPLVAVVVLMVFGGHSALQHVSRRLNVADFQRWILTTALVAVVVASLGYGTIRRNRDYHSELGMWQDVVDKRPTNDRGHYNLGRYLLDRDDLNGALAAFSRALEVNPRFVEARYNMGKVVARLGRPDEAAKHYMDALELDPNVAEAHNDLGNILAKNGWIEQAIHHYRQAINAEPGYVQAHYNLGNMLLARGEIDEAVKELQQALRLSPGTAKIHYALGNAYLKQDKPAEAVAEYRGTLELEPGHAKAREALDAALAGQTTVPPP
jgi:Flp pilus assembly protein TadD